MVSDNTHLSRRDLARVGTGLAALALPMAGAMAIEPAVPHSRIPAQDRGEIIELMARYAWAYDTGEIQDLLDTFTDDGTMVVFGDLIGGKDQIGPFIADAVTRRGTAGWQHLTDHHIFRDFTGDLCTAYSFYLMAEADETGANGRVRAMGYYTSYCRKENGEWLFARRDVTRWNSHRPW